MVGTYLEGEKEARIEVLNFILSNEEYLERADLRDYPKGLTTCLVAKNREIRNQAEKVFERVI